MDTEIGITLSKKLRSFASACKDKETLRKLRLKHADLDARKKVLTQELRVQIKRTKSGLRKLTAKKKEALKLPEQIRKLQSMCPCEEKHDLLKNELDTLTRKNEEYLTASKRLEELQKWNAKASTQQSLCALTKQKAELDTLERRKEMVETHAEKSKFIRAASITVDIAPNIPPVRGERMTGQIIEEVIGCMPYLYRRTHHAHPEEWDAPHIHVTHEDTHATGKREADKEYLAYTIAIDVMTKADRMLLFFALKGRDVCVRKGKNETFEVFCRATARDLRGRNKPGIGRA